MKDITKSGVEMRKKVEDEIRATFKKIEDEETREWLVEVAMYGADVTMTQVATEISSAVSMVTAMAEPTTTKH